MSVIKPMLLEDWDEKTQEFPVMLFPKVDGVRGLTLNGPMVGRSLKTHANKFTTARYSHDLLRGLDGELIIGDDPYRQDLCRLTTSALNTITGTPATTWWLFDYVTPETIGWVYAKRLDALRKRAEFLHSEGFESLRVIEGSMVKNHDELLELETSWCVKGMEGAVICDPNGAYKQGRVTVLEGTKLRIKRFITEEALVLDIEEGRQNNNKAQTNELGKTFRSTHKENMVPNGMVGALICRTLKDARDPHTHEVVLPAGTIIKVSPGKMTKKEALHFFQNPHLIKGQVIKYTLFPKGIKDRPRFPQYQCVRAPSDIG